MHIKIYTRENRPFPSQLLENWNEQIEVQLFVFGHFFSHKFLNVSESSPSLTFIEIVGLKPESAVSKIMLYDVCFTCYQLNLGLFIIPFCFVFFFQFTTFFFFLRDEKNNGSVEIADISQHSQPGTCRVPSTVNNDPPIATQNHFRTY